LSHLAEFRQTRGNISFIVEVITVKFFFAFCVYAEAEEVDISSFTVNIM